MVPGAKIEFEELRVTVPFPVYINFTAGRERLPVDVYFLADNTGSMSADIATVKERFIEILTIVMSDERFSDAHFGVGAYQDENSPGTSNGFIHLQSLTSSTSAAQAAVNEYVAAGGGDGDEANLVALYKVATESIIGWRTNSRKVLVYFGDYPGHEPTCGPFGTLDREVVVRELKNKKIAVIGISLRGNTFDERAPVALTGCSGPDAAAGQASFITSETGGSLGNADATTIVDEIIEKISELTSVFEVDTSDCMGKLETTFSPPLPIVLDPGESQVVTQTMTVPASFCSGLSDKFTCTIEYLESGASLPTTVVETKKVTGC